MLWYDLLSLNTDYYQSPLTRLRARRLVKHVLLCTYGYKIVFGLMRQ